MVWAMAKESISVTLVIDGVVVQYISRRLLRSQYFNVILSQSFAMFSLMTSKLSSSAVSTPLFTKA